MSVPYKIEASEELLVAGGGGGSRASDRIPFMARPFVSERAKKTLDLVRSYSTSMVASQGMLTLSLGREVRRRRMYPRRHRIRTADRPRRAGTIQLPSTGDRGLEEASKVIGLVEHVLAEESLQRGRWL